MRCSNRKLLIVFEGSAQRERTIDELKIGNFKMGIGIAEKATKQEGIAGVVM